MFCTKCGKEILEENNFCNYCGAPVKSKEPIQEPIQEPVQEKEELIPPPITEEKNEKEEKKGNKALIVILIILGVLFVTLIGIIGVILGISYFGDKESEPESDAPIVREYEIISHYDVYKSDNTWYQAKNFAESMGGYLVSINDKQEFNEVCALADAANIKVFWVGAKRNSYDRWSEAYWQDGTEMLYSFWLKDEPTYYDEEGNEELYLLVFKVGDKWYYNDAVGDVSSYYSGRMGYIVETEERVYND